MPLTSVHLVLRARKVQKQEQILCNFALQDCFLGSCKNLFVRVRVTFANNVFKTTG